MWSNQKMKSATFIHNDDAKCFHVVVQVTRKLVMMGFINFKHHVLIERWQVGKKMNLMGNKFKDEKNEVIIKSNLHLLLEVVCVFQVLGFIIA
jgi:hypothetical protein